MKLSWPAWMRKPHCVPDLELDALGFYVYHLGSEFDADGDIMLVAIPVICELKEETGLANA